MLRKNCAESRHQRPWKKVSEEKKEDAGCVLFVWPGVGGESIYLV